MPRLFPLFVLLLAGGCGLADDPRDEENKHISVTLPDPEFRDYCLREFDSDGDGRLSRYEARRVRSVACPGLGIASLAGIEEFVRLERLDCSGNRLASLDVSACTLLRDLDCADNGIAALDLGGLRSLVSLDCSGNALDRLDLRTPSLAVLSCARNRLTTLDVSGCAGTMERVDARSNPPLGRLYVRRGQVRQLQYDPPTVVEEL